MLLTGLTSLARVTVWGHDTATAPYPVRLADLVAEERQRRADFQGRLAQAREEDPSRS